MDRKVNSPSQDLEIEPEDRSNRSSALYVVFI